jgi:hypothetical protein
LLARDGAGASAHIRGADVATTSSGVVMVSEAA